MGSGFGIYLRSQSRGMIVGEMHSKQKASKVPMLLGTQWH
ncbi:hypothetical protein A2U01_0110448, partial [Trifolium medium]|nr:hypothetical protein [Trifolium medium]